MPYKDPEKQKKAQRDWARRNRDKMNASKQKRRKERLAYIHERKKDPCMDCGQTFPPCAMDFHHRGEKLMRVGRMANECSTFKAIDEEIAKCDLLCANCHRIRHG